MSLCLIEDGQPVFAMVYDAYRKEFFHAIRFVQEAQGSVTDLNGGAFTWGASGIIAGNEALRAEIQTLLTR
ncbi:hypothetical protein LQV63_20570 [Paenibacillus profundus]|uniref:Uncharacterized protein n=1 Tax=Paenibacillus profundus TaxID=1173085 RepID=A0ABS8YID5_9BACL|nr:hypothetical protein [Paenibacillus profundus]